MEAVKYRDRMPWGGVREARGRMRGKKGADIAGATTLNPFADHSLSIDTFSRAAVRAFADMARMPCGGRVGKFATNVEHAFGLCGALAARPEEQAFRHFASARARLAVE